jgi:hypothetical protein
MCLFEARQSSNFILLLSVSDAQQILDTYLLNEYMSCILEAQSAKAIMKKEERKMPSVNIRES